MAILCCAAVPQPRGDKGVVAMPSTLQADVLHVEIAARHYSACHRLGGQFFGAAPQTASQTHHDHKHLCRAFSCNPDISKAFVTRDGDPLLKRCEIHSVV